MRIGILTLAAGRQAGGPETYEIELVRALSHCDPQNQYFVYCTSPEAREAFGPLAPNFQVIVLRPASRWLSLSVTAPLLFRRHRIELLHATYAAPPLYTGPLVLTIHGLVNILHPEFFPSWIRFRLNLLMQSSVRRATRILCVSEHARLQTLEIFPSAADKADCAHHGVSNTFRPLPPEIIEATRARLGVPQKYFLFAGKIQSGKNIERLLEAYQSFASRAGDEIALVLAGRCVDPNLTSKVRDRQSQGQILCLGHLDSDTLAALYNGAEALIFPSLFESFGFPILEAMACGTPVITATHAAMPEIAGDAALLVDPLSIEDMTDALLRISYSGELRNDLIERGFSRARQFTWDQCAQRTLATYRRAIGDA